MLQIKKQLLLIIALQASLFCTAQLNIGDTAPEITLPDVKDSVIKLSSLQGKVVLVDFWASWCAPCRAANPYVQKLYKKYKDQGFEVYAVSIDKKKEYWQKAMRQDRLTYISVIDNEEWNSKTGERYFVDLLPTNFLLDKTGKIVAININGKELFDKVKLMLK